jgi:hypothetical protein
VEINCTNTAIEMAHEYAKQNPKEQVTLSEEFKQHAMLFLDEDVKTFPPTQPWDYKIKLTEEAPASFNQKIYPMS